MNWQFLAKYNRSRHTSDTTCPHAHPSCHASNTAPCPTHGPGNRGWFCFCPDEAFCPRSSRTGAIVADAFEPHITLATFAASPVPPPPLLPSGRSVLSSQILKPATLLCCQLNKLLFASKIVVVLNFGSYLTIKQKNIFLK